jgi:hypothetical protein
MKSFIIRFLHQILLEWSVKEDEMGEHVARKVAMRNIQKIFVEKPQREDHLGVLDVNER